ncbi:uncharacterized protein LOC111695975 isoform X5 [Eurytemora carolleeae]|uniref:uncharacterized protein LOC111695975 isoform X5 n=1 Tax=Eurytemora carolleeae TaxID=1294199 RepID=UPI000C76A7C0|nr:uncharacterized protein LOC111695975 isoform X5 [Eurytemora carolleeae]|eukprot:XP_023321244.1 uncharacterized protein LOC111695975 isoform X5 [Eurytemora affinis]
MSKSGGAGSNTQKLKERCLEKLIGFQDLEYNYLVSLDKEEGNRETAKPWSSCEQECRRCSKVIGVLLAAVSGVFFTLCSVTVKLVKSLDPLNIMLARATVQFVLILPILALVNLDMKAIRANRFYILIHGLVGSLTVLSIFIGFSRIEHLSRKKNDTIFVISTISQKYIFQTACRRRSDHYIQFSSSCYDSELVVAGRTLWSL